MDQKTQPTVSKHWRKRSPKDQASIPLGPPHCADNNTTYMQYEKKTKYTQINTTNLGCAQWNAPSVTKPNPENCKNCSSKCAYDGAQLSYTIQHRTVLIISLLISRQTKPGRIALIVGQNGTHLQEEVERNPREQDVGKELGNREDAEDDPVRQPLRVIFFVDRLNGFHSAHQPEYTT